MSDKVPEAHYRPALFGPKTSNPEQIEKEFHTLSLADPMVHAVVQYGCHYKLSAENTLRLGIIALCKQRDHFRDELIEILTQQPVIVEASSNK